MIKTHMLIIDNDDCLIKTLELLFREDYKVIVANSGVQGLKLARRIVPEFIILGDLVPNMDGYKVCQELRQDFRLKHVPILFLSGNATMEAKINAFEAGADDYVFNPFDHRELSLRVKALMRRSQIKPLPAPKTILKRGDLTLNCKTFQVTINTNVINLTPVEFDLMYHLMSHPGQAFPSIRLLQEVWDYPSDAGSPDVVRMHIKNLRYKIEPDPHKPIYIQTLPRHGYRIS